jgi:hypothetical protein
MLHTKTMLLGSISLSLALGACGQKTDPAADAAKKKKEFDDAAGIVAPAISKISAFAVHLTPVDDKDPYTPKSRQWEDRAGTAAANEIRHEATATRQALKKLGSPAMEGLEKAFDDVSAKCADVKEVEKMPGCITSVKGLDTALEKAGADASAAGSSAKFPRVGKDAITKEGEAATQKLATARGPGPEETAYRKVRGDAKASFDTLDAACQKAQQESDDIAVQYENADEPVRLVAVTRKMGMASQCKKLRTASAARTEMEVCKTKPKSTECAVGCGKVKAVIDEGIPAAHFEVLKKEQEDACKSVK